MATLKNKLTKSPAPQANQASAPDKTVSVLEAKVANLEAALNALKTDLSKHCDKSAAEHTQLAAKCAAAAVQKPSTGGLSSEEKSRLDRVWSFCRKLGLR